MAEVVHSEIGVAERGSSSQPPVPKPVLLPKSCGSHRKVTALLPLPQHLRNYADSDLPIRNTLPSISDLPDLTVIFLKPKCSIASGRCRVSV